MPIGPSQPLDTPPPASPHPLRRPERLLAAVGVVVAILAAFQPYETSTDVFGVRTVMSGFEGAADGLTEILFAGGLLAFLASRSAVGTRLRVLQLVPAALGLAAFFIALDAWRVAETETHAAAAAGGHGVMEPGIWLMIGGSAIAAIGGVLSTIVIYRSNPPERRPAAQRSPGLGFVGGVLAAVIGAVAGGLIAAQVAYAVYGADSVPGSLASGYLAVIGGALGIGVGLTIWRRMRPARPVNPSAIRTTHEYRRR